MLCMYIMSLSWQDQQLGRRLASLKSHFWLRHPGNNVSRIGSHHYTIGMPAAYHVVRTAISARNIWCQSQSALSSILSSSAQGDCMCAELSSSLLSMACYGPFDNFTRGLHHFSSLCFGSSTIEEEEEGRTSLYVSKGSHITSEHLFGGWGSYSWDAQSEKVAEIVQKA